MTRDTKLVVQIIFAALVLLWIIAIGIAMTIGPTI